MKKTILVVEDEAAIREMIRFFLEPAGFLVKEAENGQQAYREIANQLPDLILLDWMLPDTSGIEMTKKCRSNPVTKQIPIIMLTARAEESHKVRGLDSGADDYVVKPFSPKELTARIKALLRRHSGEDKAGVVTQGRLVVNLVKQHVLVDGLEIKLSALEFRLLQFFVNNLDRVFTRSQLLDAVWGGQADVTERAVDVVIRRLRKALGESVALQLQTLRGSGYRFVSDD